jgi:hypothetical protein
MGAFKLGFMVILCAAMIRSTALAADSLFIRGDANCDGLIDISDPVTIMAYLQQGRPVNCKNACDVTNNTAITAADANYLYDFLYYGGPAPPAPYPACGLDSGGNLGCTSHPWCDNGIRPAGPHTLGTLQIEDFRIPPDGPGTARIVAFDPGSTEVKKLQGFQVGVNSPPNLELVDINIAGTFPEQEGAELIIAKILDPHAAGLLVVVMDLNEPFELQTIPLSEDPVHIGNFVYACNDHPAVPARPASHSLSLSSLSYVFKDGEIFKTDHINGTALCLADECPSPDLNPTIVIGGCVDTPD